VSGTTRCSARSAAASVSRSRNALITLHSVLFRDAGANAVQEMAFTLADGVTYCDTVVERGRMTIDKFAPQISFFFYAHGDFFEEIAKYRAGRRRWATIVRERYGATSDKASMFRFGCVSGGASLYGPQAQNNIVRVAYEAMASVLGGVQSMFTAAWDEPFALPTEESATLALRTQQILAYETGVAAVADPLGGSYFVEALTDATEEKIIEIMGDLEAFLQNATRTYQGSQADAFRALHFDLQDEQETIRKCLEFLTVGAQDSGTSLVTSNDQIAQDQAQLQKSFAGGSIFGGLTGSR